MLGLVQPHRTTLNTIIKMSLQVHVLASKVTRLKLILEALGVRNDRCRRISLKRSPE